MRLQFISQATFERMTVNDWGQDDTSRITAYFHTPSVVISEGHPLDLDAVIAHFNERVAGFTRRGSGYILASIDELRASFVKFRPLGAGSFVSTPQWIENKHAIVNIRNQADDKCFVWSILAHLYPAKHKAERVINYKQYEHTLNLTCLTFPLPVKQIAKFECTNPSSLFGLRSRQSQLFDSVPQSRGPQTRAHDHVAVVRRSSRRTKASLCLGQKFICADIGLQSKRSQMTRLSVVPASFQQRKSTERSLSLLPHPQTPKHQISRPQRF